ncbi:YebC/PmpR family DNA-binding transcriptional regulator [Carboxylicivirga marina]|uniref:Probable transcriptional regulatory protein JIV24_13525 n=1 Tax=Carboxylicivirga marina TaxID=2800988 RepID=A0ABS1HL00_9BACT|nr:YebC/PmpR family DNA-binding transcriptional regulator [Carboxylicivirga marina]MBK3518358.1 YebC/PmpR family DNA-binding transcriptional regulator [Carboxylicivirga marina]
MGRAFEYRKASKLKRWGTMAKTFTKIGKQITMCVKESGPDPSSNSRLRVLIQNAKAANMPKDNVERAIKKASSKDTADYKEVVYEGYGPFGTAFMVETATDNTTRTVANVRSYFNKYGGSLGTSGCVDYMFEHKCNFKVELKEGLDLEELELELIDFGVQEIFEDDGFIMIYGDFEGFGPIQKYLEDNDFKIENAEFERIPQDSKELNDEQMAEIDKLLAKFEEDDDVTNVFNNIK